MSIQGDVSYLKRWEKASQMRTDARVTSVGAFVITALIVVYAMKQLDSSYSHVLFYIAVFLPFTIGAAKMVQEAFRFSTIYYRIGFFIRTYGPQAAIGTALALGIAGDVALWRSGSIARHLPLVAAWTIAPVVALCFLVLAHVNFNRVDVKSN